MRQLQISDGDRGENRQVSSDGFWAKHKYPQPEPVCLHGGPINALGASFLLRR